MVRFRFDPFLDADKGDGAGNVVESDTTATDAKPGEQGEAGVMFTTEQQAAINKMIGDARRDGRKAAETDAERKRRESDESRERDEQIKRGEFDAVRTGLETKVTELSTVKDTLAQTLTAYETEFAPVIAAKLAAVPETAKAGFPQDASPLEQLKWLNDPRTVALIEREAETQKIADARNGARNPMTPIPNGNAKEAAQEAERQRLLRTGKYGI